MVLGVEWMGPAQIRDKRVLEKQCLIVVVLWIQTVLVQGPGPACTGCVAMDKWHVFS